MTTMTLVESPISLRSRWSLGRGRRRVVAGAGVPAHAEARPLGERAGAGEGNRTLVVSLGSFCSAIELHPRPSQRYRQLRLSDQDGPRVAGRRQPPAALGRGDRGPAAV